MVSASIIFALMAVCLISIPLQVSASSVNCVNNVCVLTDTSVVDFAAGQFYLSGLRNLGDGEVQLLPLGVTSNWAADTFNLPEARAELAAVIYRDRILAIGGFNAPGVEQTSIYSATTTVGGAIAAPGWNLVDNLPNARASMAAVISPTQNGGYLYVLGGSTTGPNLTSTILYKGLDSSGMPTGSWQSTSMPNNLSLVYHQAIVHGGFLYVLGGHDRFYNYKDIYRAPINADGSLGAWITETNSIPDAGGNAGRYSFAAVTFQGETGTDYLYVIAGRAGNLSTPVSVADVHYAQFMSNGSIGAWSAASSLPNAFNAHAAVQGNGQIYVTGGSEGINISQAITKVQSALIDAPTGNLRDLGGGRFWVVSQPLAEPRVYHASVINSGGQIYVIGGYDQNGTAKTTTYRGASSGVGSTYAPAGNYTSRIINFGGAYQLNTLNWNTSVAPMTETLTLQYRTADTQNTLLAQSWTTLGNAAAGNNLTNTSTFTDVFGTYFQYRVLMTTTAPYTHSPALNLIELHYSRNGPDLQVSMSDGVSTARIGQVLTYTIVYTNNDPRGSPGTVLTLTPPLSTTFLRGTAGWAAAGGAYTLTLGNLAAGVSGTAIFVVQVNGKPAGGVLNSIVQIGYDGSLGNDPNPVNNTAIDSDSVAVVDLYISTDDLKSSIVVSATNTYTTTFGNSGQLTATNVIITDTIPANTLYIGGPAWTNRGNGVFTYNAGMLAPGQSGSIAFTIFISDTYPGGPLTNTVQIGYDGSQGPDGDPANNIFSDIDNVLPSGPDLLVLKSDGRSAVFAGDLLTYTIAYNNVGGSTATNVMLTETLPANTSFVGPTDWNFVGGATYTRSIGNVSPSQSSSVQFVVRVNDSAPVGPITNTVRIGASNESSLLTGNNVATDVDTVTTTRIDLQVSVNDGVSTPKAGQLLTYTINYANVGTSAASSAVLNATLSPGLIFAGTGWAALGGGLYQRNLGNVAAGASGSVTLIAQVSSTVSPGTFVSNTVTIDFAGLDANPADNTSSDVDYIDPPHLVLQKDDGVAVVQPGQSLTYIFTYRNVGSTMANNIVLTETPPSSFVVIGSNPGWSPVGSAYVRSLPALAPGAVASTTFSLQVSPSTSNGALITNTARISADQATVSSDNASTDVDVVSTTGGPDIRILGASVGRAPLGQPTPVVITLTNAGAVGTNTWFFTDLYIDRVPTSRTDLGDSYASVASAQRTRPRATVMIAAGLLPNETRVVTINAVFNAVGSHQLYLQADTCDSSSVGPTGNCLDLSYGRIAETNEANNVYGPVNVMVGSNIYLPLIVR